MWRVRQREDWATRTKAILGHRRSGKHRRLPGPASSGCASRLQGRAVSHSVKPVGNGRRPVTARRVVIRESESLDRRRRCSRGSFFAPFGLRSLSAELAVAAPTGESPEALTRQAKKAQTPCDSLFPARAVTGMPFVRTFNL